MLPTCVPLHSQHSRAAIPGEHNNPESLSISYRQVFETIAKQNTWTAELWQEILKSTSPRTCRRLIIECEVLFIAYSSPNVTHLKTATTWTTPVEAGVVFLAIYVCNKPLKKRPAFTHSHTGSVNTTVLCLPDPALLMHLTTWSGSTVLCFYIHFANFSS